MWTPEKMTAVLNRNNEQLCKALVKLYEYQTADEQAEGSTKHSNGVGFNGSDAKILTSFAQQYQKKAYLSDKQIACVRKKLMKYTKQLCKIANIEADRRQAEEDAQAEAYLLQHPECDSRNISCAELAMEVVL